MTASRFGAVLLIAALAATALPAPPSAPAPPTVPVAIAKADSSAADVLYRHVNFSGIDDPKINLREALDILSDRYGVQFEVNVQAFKFEMVEDVLLKEIASPHPVPPMKNARLDHVLRRLLSRIVTNSGATFVARRDFIEITTGLFRECEIWGNGRAGGTMLPLVHRKFDKVPLDQVLNELADLTDFNIVLDPRTAEKGKVAVTARFLNTPLDTAVRYLADMADLRSFQQDNMLYVTSKENAAIWEARLRKERGLEEPLSEGSVTGGIPRLGSGPGVHAGVITPP
jgi:hypothetical protein